MQLVLVPNTQQDCCFINICQSTHLCVESEMWNLKFRSGLTSEGRQHLRLSLCQVNFEDSSLTTLVIVVLACWTTLRCFLRWWCMQPWSSYPEANCTLSCQAARTCNPACSSIVWITTQWCLKDELGSEMPVPQQNLVSKISSSLRLQNYLLTQLYFLSCHRQERLLL